MKALLAIGLVAIDEGKCVTNNHLMLNFILSLFLFPQADNTNYLKIVTTLRQIAQEHPQTTQLISIGVSDAGQVIYGLQIGRGSRADLIVGTHHGNEYGSTAVAMGLANSIAENPIDGHTVYLIPVLNIQGYNSFVRTETVGQTTVDPNRDYPGPCVSTATFKSRSTRALAEFVAQKKIVASATLHTYWPAALIPWGLSTKDLRTRDEDTFLRLGKLAVQESGYAVGNSTELLYAADGTFEDYAYWKHGIWSLLFELGESHSPDPTAVEHMVNVNVPGIRRFLENAPAAVSQTHSFDGRCDKTRVPQRRWPE